jgi:hypothetical protein
MVLTRAHGIIMKVQLILDLGRMSRILRQFGLRMILIPCSNISECLLSVSMVVL